MALLHYCAEPSGHSNYFPLGIEPLAKLLHDRRTERERGRTKSRNADRNVASLRTELEVSKALVVQLRTDRYHRPKAIAIAVAAAVAVALVLAAAVAVLKLVVLAPHVALIIFPQIVTNSYNTVGCITSERVAPCDLIQQCWDAIQSQGTGRTVGPASPAP